MADEDNKLPSNHLTAKELMLTRGIRAQAYDEYATSSQVLPKYGEKLFEPNGSWLQDKQISTNLENMRDLLKIERVNRLSHLASAVWLPDERRALVTKRSGVEWINYGIELNAKLYLIPEEALLLMEMNCLELIWNNLSLSIQQAYDLLLNSPHSDATLSEYRVFSHLSRLGYRLQRFHYEASTNHSEDSPHPKKKVIIVPENGQWMSDQKPEQKSPETPEQRDKIEEEVKETLKTIINQIDNAENPKTNGNSINPDLEETRSKPKTTKLEIVSEETVIDPIKIIRTSTTTEQQVKQSPKWTAARIQRNVKQLPRRNDNKRKSIQHCPDKRLMDPSSFPKSKKIKHEVIELSDDDVQEIPVIPSRMDLLNQFPNTINNERIRITSDYAPHNVKPHKLFYQCDRRRIEAVIQTDKRLRLSAKSDKSLVPYANSYNHRFGDDRHAGPSWRQNNHQNGQHYHQNGQNYHQNSPYGYNRSLRTSQYFPDGNMEENVVINQMNCNVYRSSYQQVNVFRNSVMLGYSMASATFHNSVNFCNNMMWQAQNFFRGRRHNSRGRGSYRGPRALNSPRHVEDSGGYQSSFTRVPASSWSELKQKWREAKTITIEDHEDERMDCSEVDFVEVNIQPLVGPRHAGSIGEVFERLRIIKPAVEKTGRKKKRNYKISYKVFPNNTINFRKSNPGMPLYNVVVTSFQKQFPQPVELNRLQQDGNSGSILFAVVSASTVYLQTGVITLPNIANEC